MRYTGRLGNLILSEMIIVLSSVCYNCATTIGTSLKNHGQYREPVICHKLLETFIYCNDIVSTERHG